MRKIAFVLFLLFCLSVPASAANFVEVTSSSEVVVYIDTDSIEKRSEYGQEYIVAWIKYIPLDDEDIGYALYFYAFNRKARQIQTLSMKEYDKKGKNVRDQSRPFLGVAYEEIAPDTLGETMYDFVVKYKK